MKSKPVDSDVKLNSQNFSLNQNTSKCLWFSGKVANCLENKLQCIIIYAFGLRHEKFNVEKLNFPAELGEKNS